LSVYQTKCPVCDPYRKLHVVPIASAMHAFTKSERMTTLAHGAKKTNLKSNEM